MKHFLTVSLFLIFTTSLLAQIRVRDNINFPDILGYKTLKCDFHTHTVFSDGDVWPTVRAEEAWREGLDAVAITDHLEYLPHKHDIKIGFDRSHEIAHPHGEALKVIVIRGGEITRSMPPGHFNAIFLNRVEKLAVDEWRDAFKAAADQGAFMFWNHPGWRGQQADGVAKWYPEHDELLEKGWFHGIEVANERAYYPEVHQWCLDKKLTMLSNSDVHQPIHQEYLVRQGDHRPFTLVFATERSEAAIKEALFDRRTVVYTGEMLIGEERFLKPLFEKSINVHTAPLVLKGRGLAYLQIRNDSQQDFHLQRISENENVETPVDIILFAGKTVLFTIRAKAEGKSGEEEISIAYKVDNLKVKPNEGLEVNIKFSVQYR